MAILKSNAGVFPIGGQGIGGKTTHGHYVEVQLPTAIANGDTLVVAHIPSSALVTGFSTKNASNVSLTFALGDAALANRYRANAALAAGAADRAVADTGLFFRTILYPTTPVVATFGAAATPAAGSTISILVHYIVDEPTTAN